MSSKRSRVHPNYKTKYRVNNWASYDKSLVEHGDLTIWMSPAAIRNWSPKPKNRRGAPAKYSNLAIETALTIRLLLHLPLRQTEGFLRSVFGLMDLNLEAPDHTTLSRRIRTVRSRLKVPSHQSPIDLVIDSSGLSILGEGQWAAAKHGGKGTQGWRKLHLGVDQNGLIVAQILTTSNIDDATTSAKIIRKLPSEIDTVIADAAYDTRPFYSAATDCGATVVVPPTKNAGGGGEPCPAREETIRAVGKIGRRDWAKEVGYHRQGKMENTFFRCKTIVGRRLRSRHPKAQETEAILACSILNRMAKLGTPESVKIQD